MKTALAALAAALSTLLLATPTHAILPVAPGVRAGAAEVAPVRAPAAPSTDRCDNPQYPACPQPIVGLSGPSRARAGTRARFTCSVRAIGTNAVPTGSFVLRLGSRGTTFWTAARRVPPSTRTILTRRLPAGRYNATCAFRPSPRTIWQSAKSGSRRLVVVRRAAA